MSLRLYGYPASANCYKVRLLLAQLGLPYERVLVDIFAGETLTEEYAAMNPARETPVLQAGNLYLPESGAILAYLAEGTRFLPDDHDERGRAALALLDSHLARHDFFAAGRYTIADLAIYGYAHVAGDAGVDLAAFPAVRAWGDRVAAQDGYMNDLEPYPDNAQLGAGRSIYG